MIPWVIWVIQTALLISSIYLAWKTLPLRHDSLNHFGSPILHILTWFGIILGFWLTLIIVFLTPLDIMFSIASENNSIPEIFKGLNTADMIGLWTQVYWVSQVCSQVTSWLFAYQRSGYLTSMTRLKSILKSWFRIRIIALVVGIGFAVGYVLESGDDPDSTAKTFLAFAKAILNSIGLTLFIIAFGIGIVLFPKHLWWGSLPARKMKQARYIAKSSQKLEANTIKWKNTYIEAVHCREQMSDCVFRDIFTNLIETTNEMATWVISGEEERRSESMDIERDLLIPSSSSNPNDSNSGRRKRRFLSKFKKKKTANSSPIVEPSSSLQPGEDSSKPLLGAGVETQNSILEPPSSSPSSSEDSRQSFTQVQKAQIRTLAFTKEHEQLAAMRQKLHWQTVEMEQARAQLLDLEEQQDAIDETRFPQLKSIYYSTLSVLFGIISILFVWSETVGLQSFLHSNTKDLNFGYLLYSKVVTPAPFLLGYCIVLFLIGYLVFTTLYALLHTEISYFHIYKIRFQHNSEPMSLLKLFGIWLLIINPIVFNFTLLLGDNGKSESSIESFYKDIEIVPFFGHLYTIYLPFLLYIIIILTLFWEKIRIYFLSTEEREMEKSAERQIHHIGKVHTEVGTLKGVSDPEFLAWQKKQNAGGTLVRNQKNQDILSEIENQDSGSPSKKSSILLYRPPVASSSSQSDQNNQHMVYNKALQVLSTPETFGVGIMTKRLPLLRRFVAVVSLEELDNGQNSLLVVPQKESKKSLHIPLQDCVELILKETASGHCVALKFQKRSRVNYFFIESSKHRSSLKSRVKNIVKRSDSVGLTTDDEDIEDNMTLYQWYKSIQVLTSKSLPNNQNN